MLHLDDDVLAGIALGDHDDTRDRDHAATCAACTRRVADLASTHTRLEALATSGGLLVPPARVWDAIRSEVGVSDAPVADRDAAGTDELAARRERKGRSTAPWMVSVAAAVGLVIGGVGVAVIADSGETRGEVVAAASLMNLATEADAGQARVERLADGTQVLVLETNYNPVEGAALEVWLIDENVEGMISVGFLTSESGTFVIPAGFDVGQFPIVDVSIEPFDGDPTHSGQSVTRGVLDA